MDPELETGKMTVLEVKDECTYVILSFCVISMKLRRARVRFFRLDDVHTVDVFFRVGDTLPGFSAVLPARAKVIQGVTILSVSIHFASYTTTSEIILHINLCRQRNFPGESAPTVWVSMRRQCSWHTSGDGMMT